MVSVFDEKGIRFKYPQSWRLEREDNPAGFTVTINSPDTAFLMVSLHEEMPSVEEMAEAALAAMREDYPELEADERVDSVAGQPAIGHDIRFFSLDFTNSCWIRSFYSGRGTVVALWQANDLELETHEKVLRAIFSSMQLSDE